MLEDLEQMSPDVPAVAIECSASRFQGGDKRAFSFASEPSLLDQIDALLYGLIRRDYADVQGLLTTRLAFAGHHRYRMATQIQAIGHDRATDHVGVVDQPIDSQRIAIGIE